MQVNVTFEGKDASFAAAFAEQMSLMGPEGKSAYEVAVANGFEGSETQWLASLVGKDGQRGADGKVGEKGDKGDRGPVGATGVGISNIRQTTTTNADGGENTVTVYLTDGTQKPFKIKNGNKGNGIKSLKQTTTSESDGGTNVMTFILDDGTQEKIRVKNGSRGLRGEKGDSFTFEDLTDEQIAELGIVRTDENGKIPASVIPSGVGGSQADWNEQSKISPAYVKNKTHSVVETNYIIGYMLNDDGTYTPIAAEKDIVVPSGSWLMKMVFVNSNIYTVDNLVGKHIKYRKYNPDNWRDCEDITIEITRDMILEVAYGTFAVMYHDAPLIMVITEELCGADVGVGFNLPSYPGIYFQYVDLNPDDIGGYCYAVTKVFKEEVIPLDEKFLPPSVMNFLRSLGYTG